MKKPDKNAYYAIQVAYYDALEGDCQNGANGRHWILMDALNTAGYRTNGTKEAMKLADKVLAGGYRE